MTTMFFIEKLPVRRNYRARANKFTKPNFMTKRKILSFIKFQRSVIFSARLHSLTLVAENDGSGYRSMCRALFILGITDLPPARDGPRQSAIVAVAALVRCAN